MFTTMLKKIETHSPISIGMRTLKTWLAATVTAFIGLTPVIFNPFYALMGAVFGMQNTVSNSFSMGIGRIIGTAVGAFIGFIFAHFSFDSPIAIGIAVALVIIICMLLNIRHSILITVTLCLLIMFNPAREGGLLFYTTRRTLDTTLGVVIAFLINRFVAPPNHLKSLVNQLEALSILTKDALENQVDWDGLQSEIATLLVIYNNYQIDEKYDKHHVSNVLLAQTVESCSALYFHFKTYSHEDKAVANYHLLEIKKTCKLLASTVTKLKGVL